jgi:hypothetical protein
MNENEHRNAHGARTLPPAPASPKNSRKLRLVGELLRAHDRRLELGTARAAILEPRNQGMPSPMTEIQSTTRMTAALPSALAVAASNETRPSEGQSSDWTRPCRDG